MSAISLISNLKSRGAKLSVVSNHLQVDAPKGVVGPEDVKQLRQRKTEIIELLQKSGDGEKIAHQIPSAQKSQLIETECLKSHTEVQCIFCGRPVEMGLAARVIVGNFNAHVHCYERVRKTKRDGSQSAKYDPNIALECECCGSQLKHSEAGIAWPRDNGRVRHKTCAERSYFTEVKTNEVSAQPPLESGPCLICRKPVERNKPGTGTLAGDDLHIECFTETGHSGYS
jgi:hypothetical protein